MLTALDHVNLRSPDTEALADWYEDVLGLTRGDRPDFGVAGVWLYLGDTAVVHLIHSTKDLSREEASLEHFAFRAKGMAAFEATLRSRGIPYEKRKVPGTEITQVNFADPMGTHLHVDFTAED